MSERQQILVVIEPDKHPEIVAERAAWMARLNDMSLALLWCDADIGPLGDSFVVSNAARDIAQQIRGAQEAMVEELAAPLREQGLEVDTAVLEERPIAEGILRHAGELQPAYVFKGTQYHHAAERSIFLDTDWHLMRSCPHPLWLVKPVGMPKQPVIIGAVDPLHTHDKPATLDTEIVDRSKDVAAATDGNVHLFHAYQPLSAIGAAATRTFKPIELSVKDISDEVRAEHREKLDELAKRCGINPAHTHQESGAASELIPAFARRVDANLIVMGVLARWGLKRAVIGSTTERVLDHLPCDILLVSATGDPANGD